MNFLIQLVVGLVLNVVVALVSNALSPKPKRQTGRRGNSQFTGPVPQFFITGTLGEPADFLTYAGEWGKNDETPNAYTVEQHAFGILPITGLTGLHVNGKAATLASGGATAQGYAVTGIQDDDAAEPRFWFWFVDGTQASASSYLLDKFGSRDEKPYLGSMVGRGVPLLTTTALWDEEYWTGFPSVVATLQGIKLYDPRRDSTAGGSGAQRWSNPSTWAFSDNQAVIVYNIYRGIHYNVPGSTGLGPHIWGYKRTAAQMPYDVWAAAMDRCDETVDLKAGGTEKRYRMGRRIELSERPADVVKDIQVSCNMRIADTATGEVFVIVDIPETVDGAFHDTDILGDETSSGTPLPKLNDVVNGASAVYLSPEEGWIEKPADPYYDDALEAADDDNRFAKNIDLRCLFSGTAVQRVLKAIVKDSRRFRRHVVALPARFSVYKPLDILRWTSPRHGYENKRFMVTVKTRSIWGFVVMGLQEVDPSDSHWNPDTDERPLYFAPVTPARPPAQVVTGVWVEPAIEQDAANKDRRGGYTVHWPATAVAVDVDQVSITHRLLGKTAPSWTGPVNRPETLLGSASVFQSLIGGETYEVWLTYITKSGRKITPSAPMQVEIPNIKLTSLDIDIQEIADEVSEFVDTKLDWTTNNTRETIERLKEFLSDSAGGAAQAYLDRQKMRRELVSVTAASKASWTEDIFTATGPTSALSLRIEELRTEVFDPVSGLPATNAVVNLLSSEIDVIEGQVSAQNNAILSLNSTVGNISADAIFRVYTSAAPSGMTSRIVLSASVTGPDGPPVQGAMIIDAGPSGAEIALVAGRVSVVTGIGASVTKDSLFTIDGGVAYISNARIRNLTAVNIAAESITADRLNVTALSAVSANLGTVTAGTISLADGKLVISGPNNRILIAD